MQLADSPVEAPASSGSRLSAISIHPGTAIPDQPPLPLGTVTLSGHAPAGGKTVALSSSHPELAEPVPPHIAISEGLSTAFFNVRINVPHAETTVTITGDLDGVAQSTPLIVRPVAKSPNSDLPPNSLSASGSAQSSAGPQAPRDHAQTSGTPSHVSSDGVSLDEARRFLQRKVQNAALLKNYAVTTNLPLDPVAIRTLNWMQMRLLRTDATLLSVDELADMATDLDLVVARIVSVTAPITLSDVGSPLEHCQWVTA